MSCSVTVWRNVNVASFFGPNNGSYLWSHILIYIHITYTYITQGRTKFKWTMSVQPIPCLAWRLQPPCLQGLFGYVWPHCQCARSATSVTAPARWLPLTVADGNSTRLGWTGATIELGVGKFPSLASGSGGLWVILWQSDSHTVWQSDTKPNQARKTEQGTLSVYAEVERPWVAQCSAVQRSAVHCSPVQCSPL